MKNTRQTLQEIQGQTNHKLTFSKYPTFPCFKINMPTIKIIV